MRFFLTSYWFVFCAFFATDIVNAWNGARIGNNKSNQVCAGRKEFLSQFGTATGWAILLAPNIANAAPPKQPKYVMERGSETKALSPCNGQPAKNNCWSTEDKGSRILVPWVPPSNLKGAESIFRDLQQTISEYPQTGQDNVDGGGWILAEEKIDNSVWYARYEFTSLRFKYVDDLEVRVDGNNSGEKISIRSSSRDGGFDYGVNASRLNYIASCLQKKGWTVKKV